jgi:hypothetical protein
MDKRFEEVIEKLEKQSSIAEDTSNQLEKVFIKVADTQLKTNKTLEEIKINLKRVLDDFNTQAKIQIEENIKDINSIKKTGITTNEELSDLGKQINDDYKIRIENLIESIKNKSTEILKIYDELEDIKKIKKDSEIILKNTILKQENIINQFKIKSNEVLGDLNFSKIAEKLKNLEKKINKLEKYGHTHTFGGTKI